MVMSAELLHNYVYIGHVKLRHMPNWFKFDLATLDIDVLEQTKVETTPFRAIYLGMFLNF